MSSDLQLREVIKDLMLFPKFEKRMVVAKKLLRSKAQPSSAAREAILWLQDVLPIEQKIPLEKLKAADEARTRDLFLGKEAFYQLNYRCF